MKPLFLFAALLTQTAVGATSQDETLSNESRNEVNQQGSRFSVGAAVINPLLFTFSLNAPPTPPAPVLPLIGAMGELRPSEEGNLWLMFGFAGTPLSISRVRPDPSTFAAGVDDQWTDFNTQSFALNAGIRYIFSPPQSIITVSGVLIASGGFSTIDTSSHVVAGGVETEVANPPRTYSFNAGLLGGAALEFPLSKQFALRYISIWINTSYTRPTELTGTNIQGFNLSLFTGHAFELRFYF